MISYCNRAHKANNWFPVRYKCEWEVFIKPKKAETVGNGGLGKNTPFFPNPNKKLSVVKAVKG